TAIAGASFAMLAVEHGRLAIYFGSALLGLGIGFSFASMANLVVEAVPPTRTGVATGINTIMRTIGGSLGGQIAATVLAGHVLIAPGLPAESGFTLGFPTAAVGIAAAFLAALAIPGSPFASRVAGARAPAG